MLGERLHSELEALRLKLLDQGQFYAADAIDHIISTIPKNLTHYYFSDRLRSNYTDRYTSCCGCNRELNLIEDDLFCSYCCPQKPTIARGKRFKD